MTEVAFVTQEMWDRAQAALRAALPIIEEHTPRLSTAGTMVSLRDQVRAAIIGAVEPAQLNVRRMSAFHCDFGCDVPSHKPGCPFYKGGLPVSEPEQS